jgi:hypothetical protein
MMPQTDVFVGQLRSSGLTRGDAEHERRGDISGCFGISVSARSNDRAKMAPEWVVPVASGDPRGPTPCESLAGVERPRRPVAGERDAGRGRASNETSHQGEVARRIRQGATGRAPRASPSPRDLTGGTRWSAARSPGQTKTPASRSRSRLPGFEGGQETFEAAASTSVVDANSNEDHPRVGQATFSWSAEDLPVRRSATTS